ncbi:MAG: N-formylglutamate amidohydrolase [Paracoccaceae bacterium]
MNPEGASPVVLVCEHASNRFPDVFGHLGLNEAARASHVAWDPGALEVATFLSQQLDAPLVAGGISRLIYDCNRQPNAFDAIPERSEAYDIPGNLGLSDADKKNRIENFYDPFRKALSAVLRHRDKPAVLVTIHSFTKVYLGATRTVELGILHDTDSRLADEMLKVGAAHSDLDIQRNQPYGAKDGVTHTLKLHDIRNGLLNVMLEIRNDLIATQSTQLKIATTIATILEDALAALDMPKQNEVTK